ncbi:MAG: hypothetical protein AAF183_10360 [Pseudomonadota bacterium]
MDLPISGARLARYLDKLGEAHGMPEEIVLGNGSESSGRAMFDWSEWTGVHLRLIEPDKPDQKDASRPPLRNVVESMNGVLRPSRRLLA